MAAKPRKVKFTPDDEEKIISFVKSYEILYDVKHKKFRDTEAKNHLWSQLANDLKCDVEAVKKKWTTMRDYLVRSKDKKTTGSAMSSKISKREESLSFLLNTSDLKSISTLPSAALNSNSQDPLAEVIDETQHFDTLSNTETPSIADSYVDDERLLFRLGSSLSQTPLAKKRRTLPMGTNGILRDFLDSPTKPSNILPQIPADDVRQFFNSMATTVGKLTPLAIARIKLKVAQIVGEEEIAWAEAAQNVQLGQQRFGHKNENKELK